LEKKSTDEKAFEQYRESLKQEATRLACFIRVYCLLHERPGDRLDELNIAPSFFQTVTYALFSVIELWIDKLFAEDSQRGLHNFLKFIEQAASVIAWADNPVTIREANALRGRGGVPLSCSGTLG
jgi:hypothetical protein